MLRRRRKSLFVRTRARIADQIASILTAAWLARLLVRGWRVSR
jgi:hypothetical protein